MGWVVTGLRRLDGLTTRGLTSPRARQRLLAVSLVLFVAISAASVSSLSGALAFTWWPAVILVLVTAPLTAFINAAEYRVMAMMNGRSVRWGEAIDLSVTATAANLLPLPGGVVIRTQALRGSGATTRGALGSNATTALAWAGCGAVAVGLLLARDALSHFAWVLILSGLGGLLAAGGLLVALRVRRVVRAAVVLVGVESVKVVISGLRLWLAFEFVGLPASLAQSVAVSAAQIIASAVGIFPGGLGLREALAGAIGAVIGLGASAAVIASAADRITGMVGSALMAAALVWRGRRGRTRSEPTGTAAQGQSSGRSA